MFFNLFEQFCEKKGVSCKRACIEMGLSNSTSTKWKKKGATPESATLVKVANYFGISLSELLFSLESNDLVATKPQNAVLRNLTHFDAKSVVKSVVKKRGRFPALSVKYRALPRGARA